MGAGLQTIRQGRGHLPVTGGASRAAQQQRPGGPFAAQQQPRPLGAVKPLVARHGDKGRPQLRQVQGQRPCRLGGVHQQRHTPAAAESGDLLQRLDAAEHVGHMVDDHRIRPGQNGPSEFLRHLLPPEGRRIHHRQAHLRYGVQGAADGVVLIAGDHHPAAGNHQRPDGDIQPVGSVHGEHHILRRRHAE